MSASTILFLDHTSQLGGAELSLARYLRVPIPGFSAAVAILEPRSIGEWELPDEVEVVHTTVASDRAPKLKVINELRRLIDDLDPVCIVCNSSNAAQYLAFVPKSGRRYFYFLRREAIPTGLSASRVWLNRCFVLRRFDGFLANSHWTASTLPERVRRSRPIEISRPISGISVGGIVRRAIGNELRCLSLSRLSPWKGVHTAIEAVVEYSGRHLRPAATIVVAGGDLFGEESYSAGLRERWTSRQVRFVGHVSDTRELLDRADVLMCLSTTPEPFGQVVVQGMAHGCVVIATDQGGPREIITHGVNGFLVPADRSDLVADILASLTSSPEAVARISAAAIETARQYTDEVTIPDFTEAIESLWNATRSKKR